jgi:hypothetical protein
MGADDIRLNSHGKIDFRAYATDNPGNHANWVSSCLRCVHAPRGPRPCYLRNADVHVSKERRSGRSHRIRPQWRPALLPCPCPSPPSLSPTLAHNLPPDTPLATYVHRSRTYHIAPSHITAALRASAALLGPSLGFLPSDINARSLRAAGAMALLCARVDSDIIRLLGRWRSDQMLRYLHVQAEPIMRHFARRMMHDGAFTLLPNPQVPL